MWCHSMEEPLHLCEVPTMYVVELMTQKRLCCSHQNHSVVMKMPQNDEMLKSYYKVHTLVQ